MSTTLDTIVNAPRKVLNFKKANEEQLRSDFTNNDLLTIVSNNESINNKLTAWSKKLLTIIYNKIPQITIRKGHSQAWVDHEALAQICKKDHALKAAKKHRTNDLWTKFKQIRNRLRNLMSRKHTDYIATMCNHITTNPKQFWTYLKT